MLYANTVKLKKYCISFCSNKHQNAVIDMENHFIVPVDRV